MGDVLFRAAKKILHEDEMASSKPDKDAVQKQIDENLKRIFEETANQPIPDQLSQLLQQLREQETRK
ncbi:NepR family anti-sigma factor [Mangrovicoccus sp. HB161399]|uniref:NepR family anti-sigma factor n=1 Tax=Mangrovicoccus sp. HB161399 TaxID=2720392 RepID=UPI0020A64F22|nr:NepR family anti-sigma factor [Mangrovicoccus sp. HB161399]